MRSRTGAWLPEDAQAASSAADTIATASRPARAGLGGFMELRRVNMLNSS
uniref:Uncharacterized protein n=1 Tax=Ralstonia solanacearum TaxID=305 RepID=A0A0S4X9F1_RALSL|nr:protein of unknown function [Ralstonia solanacearum]CUV60647.1 protein of unknown function [Ralstonia solanacearum]